MSDDEIITEEEWFNRMMQKKVYDVLMIDWKHSTTRVVDRYTGDIYDVTAIKVGKLFWMKLHRLE